MKQGNKRLLFCIILLICTSHAVSAIYNTQDYTTIYSINMNNYLIFNPVNFGLLQSSHRGIGVTCQEYISSGGTRFWLNLYGSNDDGTFFTVQNNVSLPVPTYRNLTGDLNGDGYYDLFSPTSLSPVECITRMSLPSGGLSGPNFFFHPEFTRLLGVCDLDGDSPPDLYGTSTGNVVVWSGTGSGQFDVVEICSGLSATSATAGDLDSDGDSDIVFLTSAGEIHILRNDGNLTFSDIGTYGPLTASGRSVALSDLNGDDHLDIVAGCLPCSGGYAFHTYLNDGEGCFFFGAGFLVNHDYDTFSIQDLDMDGYPDLTVMYDYDLDIYKGDGTVSFVRVPTLFSCTDVSPASVVFDDYNSDGYPELVCVRNPSGAEYYLVCYWNNASTQGCGGEMFFSDELSLTASSNPFSNTVTITTSECLSPVQLSVLDISGRLISQPLPEHDGLYQWNGTMVNGEQAPSGVYIIFAETSDIFATARLIKLD